MSYGRKELVRLGEDPMGRDEPTIYYRFPDRPDLGQLYVWQKIASADELALLSPSPSPRP